MAFCKFSDNFFIKNKTAVDNSFIALFLPHLPPVVVKVYVYGLYLCENPHSDDNSLQKMAKVLNLSESEIVESFKILEAEKLVQILNLDEMNVLFVEAPDFVSARKFDKNKYASFNTQIQNLFLGERQVTPTEFAEYYNVIENFKVEADALLLIAKYATEIKGKNVGYVYINTIAKNWAAEGVKTVKDVNEKLLEQERALGSLKDILSALKIFRIASIEERQTYVKWKKDLGLTDEAILFATKYAKNSFNKLDANLTKYVAMGITSVKEIEAFEKTKKKTTELAKTVVKNLGLYYENSEPVIENYITPWLNMGFNADFIELFSKMCFKKNVRTLDGMDARIKTLYKKGVLTLSALDQLNESVVKVDNEIREVLQCAGLVRDVTNFDRSMFNTWTVSWELPFDLICFVAKKSNLAANPIQYMNKILKDLKAQGITTLAQAEKTKIAVDTSTSTSTKKVNSNYYKNEYNATELNSLFANLDEVLDE